MQGRVRGSGRVGAMGRAGYRPHLAEAHHTPHCCLCPARSCAGHSQTQRGSHMQKWCCAAWPQAVSAAAAPMGGRRQGLGCHHTPHLSCGGCAWTRTPLSRSAAPLGRSGHPPRLPHDLEQPDSKLKARAALKKRKSHSETSVAFLQEAVACTSLFRLHYSI